MNSADTNSQPSLKRKRESMYDQPRAEPCGTGGKKTRSAPKEDPFVQCPDCGKEARRNVILRHQSRYEGRCGKTKHRVSDQKMNRIDTSPLPPPVKTSPPSSPENPRPPSPPVSKTYVLYFTADLENLTELQPRGGVDKPTFTYFIKLKCEGCGEVTEKETAVSLKHKVELPTGDFTNLIQKCSCCSKEGTVTMIPNKGSPLDLADSEAGKYAPLMAFECRGVKPVGYTLSHDCWQALNVSGRHGKKLKDIDLSGGGFSKYGKKKNAVRISNVRSKFREVDLSDKTI